MNTGSSFALQLLAMPLQITTWLLLTVFMVPTVRKCKSCRVQKLTKTQKKSGTVVCSLCTTVPIFFCSFL